MRVIGIDPGSNGGLVEVVYDGSAIGMTRGLRMPWTDTGRANPELDVCGLRDWVLGDFGTPPAVVVVEAQQFFGGAEKSAFGSLRLVGGYREMLGAFKALGWPYQPVESRVWQSVLGTVKLPAIPKAEKGAKPTKAEAADLKRQQTAARKARRAAIGKAMVATARRLYPGAALTPGKCKNPHEGLVAALLIAHYGITQVQGVGPRPGRRKS